MGHPPIAVAGLALRLPGGVSSLADLSTLIQTGGETLRPVDRRWDPRRWWSDGAPRAGRSVTRHAHLLDAVDTFDAELFGIAPREARQMDPQQRLLLEVAWEALERAGCPPGSLQGARVGVYVGMGLVDWERRTLGAAPDAIDAWTGTGVYPAISAGRIAYAFGFQGPALAVHTACSSGLVAVHLATRALRAGEIDVAIAGGVNLLLDPEPFVAFSQLGALSPDGRCRSFDARGAGYGRGEGCALAVLTRADDAPRPLAWIRGTATNQDGRSFGLTAPNGRAQQALLRDALADAGLAPDDIGYLEAHGTGTPLGDPIEASAIAAVFGDGDRPLAVRSVKGNLGHLEAAAGIAGLAAAIAGLSADQVTAQRDFERLNPRIDLTGTRIRIGADVAWGSGRRFAGVSAFGLSGTNAHLVLEAAHPPGPRAQPAPRERALVLSAATDAALRRQIDAVRARPDVDPDALCAAAAARAHLRHRVVAVGEDTPTLLEDLARARPAVARRGPVVAWVFTGQGSQHPELLRGFDDEPAFRDAFDAADGWLQPHLGVSLRDRVRAGALTDTAIAQPLLFAFGWALAALWRRWGLAPDAVAGHSVGALTAAAVAGAVDPAEAAALVALRGRLMGDLAPGWGMLAVSGDGAADWADAAVALAADNAPGEAVYAGTDAALADLARRAEGRGLRTRRLDVSHGFHSAQMDPVLTPFAAAADAVVWRRPSVPFVSDVDGQLRDAFDGAYWASHLRNPVRWVEAVRGLLGVGATAFLELGPAPVLSAAGTRIAPTADWWPSARRTGPVARAAAAGLWRAGAPVDWPRVTGPATDPDALPTYPFTPTHFWIDRADAAIAEPVDWTLRWVQAAPGPVRPLVGAIGDRLAAALGVPAIAEDAIPEGPIVWDARGETALDAVAQASRWLAAARGPLWIVTAGGAPGDAVPAQAALWGFAAVAAVERGERWGGVIDADDDHVLAAWLGGVEDRVRIRAGQATVPRIVPAEPGGEPTRIDPEKVHVVLGGTGAVGRACVAALAARGARTIAVVARRAPEAPLTLAGVAVTAHTADATDPAALREVLAALGPIGWCIHAIGAPAPAPIDGITPADLTRAAAAKQGALTALRSLPPCDALVVATSVSALWGGAGLGAYAAANAWADAEVAQLRGAGWRAASIAFGPWEGGLADDASLARFARAGVSPLSPAAALARLDDALDRPGPAIVARVEVAALRAALDARRPRHLWSDPTAPTAPPPAAGPRLTPADARAAVDAAARAELGLTPDAHLDPTRGWFELGLDSIMAVSLAARLSRALGRTLPPTTAFDHPTPDALVAALTDPDDRPAVDARPPVPGAGAPIAIVGLALRVPGADTPDALWSLLDGGPDPLGPAPADRGLAPGRVGGWRPDLADFDPESFGMSPREAEAVDPQQRLLLEVCAEALARAGLPPSALAGSATGVYVGIGRPEYAGRIRKDHPAFGWSGTGNEPSFAAGRVAYALSLRGPAMAVQTACSASLVALHLAVRALRAGECTLAVAGGANALLDDDGFAWLDTLGALSPTGRCRTFDAGADGYVRSEGAGAVALATVAEAERRGWPILAVVHGSAVNHDGRTAGLTAPNGAAQEAVIRAALSDAGVSPAQIACVEAHGTGTPLGDPIEARALARALEAGPDRVLVTAVKSHIGHLEAAAGIAGVAAAVLALRAGRAPAVRHFHAANAALPGAPIWVSPGAPLPPGGLIGVSAFGFSGTNAHVVLGPAPTGAPLAPAFTPPDPNKRVRCWIDSDPAPRAWVWRAVAAPTTRVPPGRWIEPPLDTPLSATRAVLDLLAHDTDPHPLAVAVRGDRPAAWAVRAAVRAAAAERPDRAIRLVDPGESPLPDAIPDVAECRWRDGAWWIERPEPAPAGAPLPVRPDHAYVVTGASGGIGRALVAWLLGRGAGRIYAISRHPAASDDPRVVPFAADLAGPTPLAGLPTDWPVGGAMHAAGTLADGWIHGRAREGLDAVFGAKVGGGEALAHWLDDHAPAAWCVWFGSAVERLGSPGQSAYSAANGALAGLSFRQQAAGRRAHCLAWGPWTVGMGAAVGWEARGIRPLAPSIALRALDAVPPGWCAVLDAAWRPPDPAPHRAPAPATALSPDAARSAVLEEARAVLRSQRLTLDQGWFDAGFDSLTAVELARRLAARTGVPLGPTALFEHPTPAALARHLAGDAVASPPSVAPDRAHEPIAIIGLALRVPGADDLDGLWRLLAAGAVPIRPVPADRWDADAWYDPEPGRPGKAYVREGGFLDDIDQFDPALFSMTDQEAAAIDPQQRLLLTLGWRALEDAGGGSWRGRNTAVYLGITDRGYLRRFPLRDGSQYPNSWAGTGNETAFAAGRMAYHLGLHGPAMAVSTTCSASLVAIQLGVAALRAGACDAALAGGASLLLQPDDTAYLCQLGALSPTHRCRAFDADADGYVRSEGGGVVVLKRLSDARAAGDRVLGVILGAAVNHDGAGSGLTVPNGEAQRDVMQRALADAGVAPAQVGYLEAHGTGTRLGDPTEIASVRAVYLADRGAPLRVGTAKANLGHLELAAGMAGLARALLVLRHGVVPPHPTLRQVNPACAVDGIRFDAGPVPTDAPLAAVSAFGLSGTNVHLVLAAGDPPGASGAAPYPALVPLSAHRPDALIPPDASPAAQAAEAAHRAPLAWRAAWVARGPDDAPPALRPVAAGDTPRIAWLFAGQGSHIAGMGRALAAASAAFRRDLDDADALLAPWMGRGLWSVLDDGDALSDTRYAQPALVALGWGLARRWEAVLGPPAAVLGHSVGGLAAAVAAGVFDLEDGLRLAALRGRWMSELPPGAMVALAGSAADVAALGLEIAAYNAEDEVVVAGPTDAVAEALTRWSGRQRTLPVQRAFHSAMLDPMLDRWAAAVDATRRHPPRFPWLSETTGRWIREAPSAADWREHARQPVRWTDALDVLRDHADVAIELGARPVLAGLVARRLPELPVVRAPLGGADERVAFLDAAGQLFVRGAGLDLSALAEAPLARVPVPPRPLKTERCWLEGDGERTQGVRWQVAWEALSAPPVRSTPPQRVWRAPLAPAVDGCAALREAARTAARDGVPLVVVTTRGADLGRPDPEQAAVRAYARAIALERPDLVRALRDEDDAHAADPWLDHDEDELAVRAGDAFAPRIERARPGSDTFRADGTWVVTGGTGALGARVAAWLVDRGATGIVLLARSAPASLPDLGVPTRLVCGSAADGDALDDALAGAAGVVHAAGITDPAAALETDDATLQRIFAGKAAGAQAIAARFDGPLVLYSSIAAVLGSKNLAAYAAANAWLDALACSRRAAGYPTWSVAWGPWDAGGMVDADRRAALERLGQRALAPTRALAALGDVLSGDAPTAIVADITWPTFLRTYEAARPRAITARQRAPAPATAAVAVVAPRTPAEVAARIEAVLARLLRRTDPLPRDTSLLELGLDSLLATELRAELARDGIPLPLGRLLGGPSLDALIAMAAPPPPEAPWPEAQAPTDAALPTALWWSHLAAIFVGAGVAWAAGIVASRLWGG
jgi:acyl transferase domain-containing protein/aryl carrier-like protein